MTTNQIKEYALGTVSVITSLLAFWRWNVITSSLVEVGDLKSYTELILPLLLLIIAAAFFALAAIFIKKTAVLYSAVILEVLGAFFFIRATTLIIGVLVVSILIGLLAAHRLRKEFAYSLGFSLSRIIKSGLPLYFTMISLIASMYYLALVDERKAAEILLPKPALDLVLRALADPLKSLTGLPRLDPNLTIDEFLTDVVQTQLQEQGISPLRLQREELAKALVFQRQALEKQYGVELAGNDTIAQTLQRVFQERIEDLLGPYVRFLPAIVALTYFFAFKALTIPLYFLTLLAAFLLLKFMLWSKMAKKTQESVEVERLTL